MNSAAEKEPISMETIMEDVHTIENIPLIQDLLNMICRTTGMRFAAVARVTDDKWVACSVHDEIEFGLKPGGELQLQTTICNEIRQSKQAIVIDNVSEDADFCNHPTPAMYGFQSYISVPIMRKDGSFFGTLCAIDPAPNKLKTDSVTTMFNTFSKLISHHINSSDEVRNSNLNLLTERELHKKIDENEARLNIVMDASGLGTWEVDLTTNELTVGDRYAEIMGYTEDTLPSWEILMKNIHPDDLEIRKIGIEKAFQTGKLHYRGRMYHPDKSIHWIEAKGKVTFEGDKPVQMIGVVADITDEMNFASMLEGKIRERTVQLHDKNEELEKINKELQAFAYVSSHDLQEPLRKIQTFAALIEQETGLPDKVKDYFERMQKAARRMQALILDLLAYSRTGTEERLFEKMDMNIIVEQVKENLKEELQQKKAVIETEGLCELNIIPFQMRQLFQNLISNSLKFSSPDREPHIKIKSEIAKDSSFKENGLSTDTKYCLITLTDNGIGFEKEYNEKIFELFQRLHARAAYNGTGIGLSIVKKIVENHEGKISADGKLGEGAEFRMYIPV